MTKFMPSVMSVVISLHAFVHLIGLYAYWPLGELADLPYKTTLIEGMWPVGEIGMTIFSLMWLVAALLLWVAAYSVAKLLPWWRSALIAGAAFSLAITALDWSMAYAGTLLNVALILFALLWTPLLRLLPATSSQTV